MPTRVKFLVISMVAVGVGMLTWGIGGVMRWNEPLVHAGEIILMDARGAIGIGVGSLAGALTAVWLFRAAVPSQVVGKAPTESDDFH